MSYLFFILKSFFFVLTYPNLISTYNIYRNTLQNIKKNNIPIDILQKLNNYQKLNIYKDILQFNIYFRIKTICSSAWVLEVELIHLAQLMYRVPYKIQKYYK